MREAARGVGRQDRVSHHFMNEIQRRIIASQYQQVFLNTPDQCCILERLTFCRPCRLVLLVEPMLYNYIRH